MFSVLARQQARGRKRLLSDDAGVDFSKSNNANSPRMIGLSIPFNFTSATWKCLSNPENTFKPQPNCHASCGWSFCANKTTSSCWISRISANHLPRLAITGKYSFNQRCQKIIASAREHRYDDFAFRSSFVNFRDGNGFPAYPIRKWFGVSGSSSSCEMGVLVSGWQLINALSLRDAFHTCSCNLLEQGFDKWICWALTLCLILAIPRYHSPPKCGAHAGLKCHFICRDGMFAIFPPSSSAISSSSICNWLAAPS